MTLGIHGIAKAALVKCTHEGGCKETLKIPCMENRPVVYMESGCSDVVVEVHIHLPNL